MIFLIYGGDAEHSRPQSRRFLAGSTGEGAFNTRLLARKPAQSIVLAG
jgi:hypothetical protein